MTSKPGWFIAGLVLASGGALLGWQRLQTEALRSECDLVRAEARELARLRSENERLQPSAPTAEKLAALRAEHAAVAVLRSQNASLLAKAEAAERARAEKKSLPPERFAAGVAVPASEWKNSGATTPAAALETTLWAAAGGDVEAFAQRILFYEAGAKAAARALLDSLPEATRSQFHSPEQLIAFLTIKDVPTGEAKVREWTGDDEKWRSVEVALSSADGRGKEVRLFLVRDPSSQEWKLSVRPSAIAKLATALKSEASAMNLPAGGK